MKLNDFLNEAKQVKAKDPKPKKVKPNKGHESPHPMRGKLVGEGNRPQKPKPYSPKQPNPVAKHSRNKSGAGAHKSSKDYDRKNKRADIQAQMDEGTLVADRGDILNSILEELRSEAYNDIGLIKHLAKLIGKKVSVRRHRHKKEGGVLQLEHEGLVETIEPTSYNTLEESVGKVITEEEFDRLAEKKDACYHKVKSRYKVWPSAYASGALVQCRKKGAKNWGNSKKK